MIDGGVVGAWSAFFFHFVIRDSLFKHITKLTYKPSELTRQKALKYCLIASAIALSNIIITCTVSYIMFSYFDFKQEWLINMRDTCGLEIPVDENGDLIDDKFKEYIYMYQMVSSVTCLLFLGLYLGQVSFRYFGRGRLSTESYTPKGALIYQLLYAITFVCLYMLPKWIIKLIDKDVTNWWYKGIVQGAIPLLIMSYIMNYWLPVLT